MTDLDLAAIKARADATYGPYVWRGGEAHHAAVCASAADVPALLARIAELEAERDAALRVANDLAFQLVEVRKVINSALDAVKESTDGR